MTGKATPEHRALLDRARRSRLGLEGYVRILAAVRHRALTTAQISDRFCLNANTAAKVMRHMLRMRLVHRESWARLVPHSRLLPAWRLGAAGDVPMPIAEIASSRPPNPMMILLATVIELIQEQPLSISDLAVELAVHRESASRIIGLLREYKLSHIHSWAQSRHGPHAPQHKYLGVADAESPGRCDKVAARKRWRTTHKLKMAHLQMIAATTYASNSRQASEAA